MNRCASLIAIVATGVVLVTACSDRPRPAVAVSMVSATAIRRPVKIKTPEGWVRTNLVDIDTFIELSNRSRSPLIVMSHTDSVLDWIQVVVTDDRGVELARVPHGYHKSPMHIPARPSALPSGTSTNRLMFPMLHLPQGIKTALIGVSGLLDAREFTGSVTSNVVKVSIEERTE